MCLSMPTLSSWSICAKQSVKLKVIYPPEERGWETWLYKSRNGCKNSLESFSVLQCTALKGVSSKPSGKDVVAPIFCF